MHLEESQDRNYDKTQYTANTKDKLKIHKDAATAIGFKPPLVSGWGVGFPPSSFLAVEGCAVPAPLLFFDGDTVGLLLNNNPSLATRKDKDSFKAKGETIKCSNPCIPPLISSKFKSLC
jgi:hypothetical protein